MPMLGVAPVAGRLFRNDEDRPGATPVVLVSHGLWQRRFASDPGVIGKTVRLNGERYAVAGIMPSRFRVGFDGPQLWTPLTLPPERLLFDAAMRAIAKRLFLRRAASAQRSFRAGVHQSR